MNYTTIHIDPGLDGINRTMPHMVAISARQIGKVTWCVLGDEDTRFYHARASARLRSNTIKVVESEGVRSFSHKEKEIIFTIYYRDILGKTASTEP
jgi:hypothetical protein